MDTYKNNVENGPGVFMHSKDQVFIQFYYLNGKKDGDYKVFCEDGRLSEHLIYLGGDVVETIIEDSDLCYR